LQDAIVQAHELQLQNIASAPVWRRLPERGYFSVMPTFEKLPLNCLSVRYLLAAASYLWDAGPAAVAGQVFEIAFVYDRLLAQLRLLLEVAFSSSPFE